MAFDSTTFNSVFNTLTTAVKTQLDLQWDAKRILGNEYAAAYTQLMDTALKLAYGDQMQQENIIAMKAKTANDAAIAAADSSLKSAQATATTAQSTADTSLKGAQKLVYDRQRKGFNDNIKQKLFEAQLNAWGLMFSSGMLETAPAFTGDSSLTTLYNGIISDLATNV